MNIHFRETIKWMALCVLGDTQASSELHALCKGTDSTKSWMKPDKCSTWPKSQRHAGHSPIEARRREQADASEKVVDARFAFVNYKAGCTVYV
jgi:hypothetical protein